MELEDDEEMEGLLFIFFRSNFRSEVGGHFIRTHTVATNIVYAIIYEHTIYYMPCCLIDSYFFCK